MRTKFFIPALVIVNLIWCAVATAVVVKNATHHFQVMIPEGWKEIAKTDWPPPYLNPSIGVTQVYQIDKNGKEAILVICAVRGVDSEADVEGFLNGYKSGRDREFKSSKVTPTRNETNYDPAKHRFVTRMDAVVGGQTNSEYSVYQLGKQDLVGMTLIYSTPDSVAYTSEVEAVAASLTFDAGYETLATGPAGSSMPSGPLEMSEHETSKMVGGAALTILIVALIVYFSTRKRRA